MATTVEELLIKIGADVSDLRGKFGEVTEQLKGLGEKGKGAGIGIKEIAIGAAAGTAAVDIFKKGLELANQALDALITTTKNAIAAAGEQEQSQQRLAAVLQASGQFSEGFVNALHDSAEALEALSGFSSEAITDAQSLFVTFGAGANQIEPLTRATIALARTFNLDLASAAKRVAIDISGESDALARLGVRHDETAGKTQRFNDLLAFTGRLADPTKLDGYTQATHRLAAAQDNVLKAFGDAIIKTPEFQAAIKASAEALNEFAGFLSANAGAIADFVSGGIRFAIDGFSLFVTAASDVVFALELMNTAFKLAQGDAATLQRIINGESLTPFADALGAAAARTAQFSQRVQDLAAEIRRSREEANKGSIAGQLAEVPPAADTAAQSLGKVGDAAGTSADAVVDAGRRIPNAFAEAESGIDASSQAIVGSVGKIPAAVGSAADQTRAQAQKAKDALKQIDESIAGIRTDTAASKLSKMDAEILKVTTQIKKVGEAAGVSAGVLEARMTQAADAVREKFTALGDVSLGDLNEAVEAATAQARAFGSELTAIPATASASFGTLAATIQRSGQSIISSSAAAEVLTERLRAMANAGLAGTDEFAKLSQQLQGIGREQGVTISADIEQFKQGIGTVTDEIARGLDPLVVKTDTKALEDLEKALRAQIAKVTDINLRVQLTADLDRAKQELGELKKESVVPLQLQDNNVGQRIDNIRSKLDTNIPPLKLAVEINEAQRNLATVKANLDRVVDPIQKEKLTLKVETQEAQLGVAEAINRINVDINEGAKPLKLQADISEATAKLEELKKKRDEVTDPAERKKLEVQIEADETKLAGAQARVNQLQTSAEQPAVKPIDADTTAAEGKIADLQAQASKPLGIGGIPFSRTVGNAATLGEIQGMIDQFRQSVASAIESGDASQLQALIAAGRDFLQTYQSTTPTAMAQGITEGIRAAGSALGSLGQLGLGQGRGGLGGDELSTALAKLREDQAQQRREEIDSQRQEFQNFTNQVVSAIRSGDAAQLIELRNTLPGSFRAPIDAALRQLGPAAVQRGEFAVSNPFGAALNDLASKLAEEQQKSFGETNSLLAESNDLIRTQIVRLDDVKGVIGGTSAALIQTINQQRVVRDSTGLRVFVLQ